MSTQRIGKYACLEIERKLLLQKVPYDLEAQAAGWRIVDRYWPDTRMRLRSLRALDGGRTIYKLTQKYRRDSQDAAHTTITNLYLTEAEFHIFEPLDALILTKRRYTYPVSGYSCSLDIFEGRHAGLVLAEVEFETDAELAGFSLPDFASRDVTTDPFFDGGNLAAMPQERFRSGLAEYLDNRL